MKIERVNSYDDPRFPKNLLLQHGCFLADGEPCTFEIISDHEAVISYQGAGDYRELVEMFRFFTCHITTFYDEKHTLVMELPAQKVFPAAVRNIQPSQFYVDADKIQAVRQFVRTSDEIIIPVVKMGDRYVSLDGHTRLYWAVMNGWDTVRCVENTSDDFVWDFVREAQSRGIFTPGDMKLLNHSTYEKEWNQYCDAYFAK